MRHRDNAPVAYTCPDIDSIIATLAGVADRLGEISASLDFSSMAHIVDDLGNQEANLRNIFEGRRSPLEELRWANESLRSWGNKEAERADDAEADLSRLRDEIRELESAR